MVKRLQQIKIDNNINGEVKWTKVTAPYLEKYKKIIDVFFDLMFEGKIKNNKGYALSN